MREGRSRRALWLHDAAGYYKARSTPTIYRGPKIGDGERMDDNSKKTAPLAGAKTEHTADLVVAIADVGIDVFTEGALDNVPVLGTALKAVRATGDIRKHLRRKKYERFFRGLDKANADEKAAFTERMKNSGEAEKVGESILLLLEHMSDTEKPEIVGRIMGAHVKGLINWGTALRLAHVVDRCYLQDLETLLRLQSGPIGLKDTEVDQLYVAGLIEHSGLDGGTPGSHDCFGKRICYANSIGKLLIEHGLSNTELSDR